MLEGDLFDAMIPNVAEETCYEAAVERLLVQR